MKKVRDKNDLKNLMKKERNSINSLFKLNTTNQQNETANLGFNK